MKKRFSFVFLFAAIVCAGLTLGGCGGGYGDDADWDYERSDTESGVIITAYKGAASGIITLPQTLYGAQVVGVKGDDEGIGIFMNTTNVNGVIIPDTFTSVGKYSFYNNQLNRATIGSGVIFIGDFSFYNNLLNRLTIGGNVTTIGIFAFSGNQLSSIVIPASVTSIGNGAFAGNPLTSIRIGANVSLPLQGESFPHGFDSYYDNNGKRAGVYTRPAGDGSTVWQYSPE